MSKEEHHKPKKHTPPKTHQKKVFDVVRPGKVLAAPNSRSVIVGHKPPVPDDQFVPTAPTLRASDPSLKHELLDSKKKKELTPLRSDAAVQTAGAAAVGAPTLPGKSGATQSPHETAPASKPETPAPAVSKPEESAQGSDQPSVPAISAASAVPDVTAANAGDAPTAPSDASETVATETRSEETPAQLALEQTVKTDMPIWEDPRTSEQVEQSPTSASQPGVGQSPASPSAPNQSNPQAAGDAATQSTASPKSIEDLLAETGAPSLEPEQTPSLIISHHKHHASWATRLLVVLLLLILAAVALNFLLDAKIITLDFKVPHTELID
jgi:hypothetical protein